VRALDEKYNIVDVVFLAASDEKRLSQNLRSGRLRLCVQQSIRLRVDSGVQSTPPSTQLNYGFISRNVI